jgi:ribosome-associated protein
VRDASQTLNVVLERLDEMKAEDIVTINLTGKTSIADTMVVASGRSSRHVGSVADDVVEHLKKSGLKQVRVEGQPHCDWVLIDAGDVIVHVFRPEVREFYAIEKMWAGGKGVNSGQKAEDAAQRRSS